MNLSLANLLISAAMSVCGTGIGVAILNGLFTRDGRRADAANTAAEAQALQHETWFDEAKDAYARVSRECADCRTELRNTEERHRVEIDKLRRELGEVKGALIKRVDAVDELLPYVQGLPEEKMHDIRASNRAVRLAVWGAGDPTSR